MQWNGIYLVHICPWSLNLLNREIEENCLCLSVMECVVWPWMDDSQWGHRSEEHIFHAWTNAQCGERRNDTFSSLKQVCKKKKRLVCKDAIWPFICKQVFREYILSTLQSCFNFFTYRIIFWRYCMSPCVVLIISWYYNDSIYILQPYNTYFCQCPNGILGVGALLTWMWLMSYCA